MRPFALAAALAAAGCSSEERLYDVSGTVTFDGKPVPLGLIYFEPDSSKGANGPQGFATITDGKFTTAGKGKGVRGGAYVVRVNAFNGKPTPEYPMGDGLCPEYTGPHDFPAAESVYDLNLTRAGKKK